MLMFVRKGPVTYFFQYRLCIACCKMFCTDREPHVHWGTNGMLFYAHIKCIPKPPPHLTLVKG